MPIICSMVIGIVLVSAEGTEQAAIEIDLQKEQTFDRIVLMEHRARGKG